MDEETATRRLSTAKARLILAENASDEGEIVAARRALEDAEFAYVKAVGL